MVEEIKTQPTAGEPGVAGPSNPQGHTGGARYGAERNDRKPTIFWAALLDEAVSKPDYIHQAYSRFYSYSLGNQLLALFQCFERGIQPGPLASFRSGKNWAGMLRRARRQLRCVCHSRVRAPVRLRKTTVASRMSNSPSLISRTRIAVTTKEQETCQRH